MAGFPPFFFALIQNVSLCYTFFQGLMPISWFQLASRQSSLKEGASMPGPIVVIGDPAAPVVAECSARGSILPGTLDSRPCVSVWHFARTSTSNPVDPANVAAAFKTWYDANVLIAQATQFTLEECSARLLDDPTSLEAVTAASGAGSLDDDLYAADTAVYFQLVTGLRGRTFMGSKHIGAATEGDITNGLLSGGGITRYQAVQTAIGLLATTGITDSDGNVWKLIVLSKSLSTLDTIPPTLKYTPVLSVLLNKRIGTMGRRRGPRELA